MVAQSYMLKKPRPPSPAKAFVDQVAFPKLIDLAAALETGIERMSVCARRSPAETAAAAFGLGWLAVQVFPSARVRRRR